MSRKSLTAILLVTLVFVLLGALPASAQDRVTIVWFVGLGTGGDPAQQEMQNNVVAAFNESQDEITLEIIIVENNVSRDTLSTLIAAGDTPDIIGPVGTSGTNAFVGNFLDLTPLIEASGYDLSQFGGPAVEFYRTEDGLLSLPFASFPSFIYYRRSLFDEAGLNYPPQEFGAPYVWPDGTETEWNMDTLREVAMLLTVDANGNDATMEEFDPENVIQWGFNFQWGEPRGMATLFGSSENPIDEDGNAYVPEHWRVAFDWFYTGIWEDHFIPNSAQEGSDLLAAGNPFASGNMAMSHSHLWYTCCLGQAFDDWDIAVVPSYNGVYISKLHADSFRIMRQTEHPEEAFTVLTYLVGEASLDLLSVYGGLPAREADQPAFFERLDERYPQGVNWEVVGASLNYPDIPNHESYLPNYQAVADRIGAFQTLFQSTAGLDIQAELDTLIADLQALFEAAP